MGTVELLTDKLLALGRSAIAALPRLVIAILVFAIIYGLARLVRRLARRRTGPSAYASSWTWR